MDGGPLEARIERYLQHLALERRMSPHTVDNYRRDLRALAEAMGARVLGSESLRKFGGDSVEEFVRNKDAFIRSLA